MLAHCTHGSVQQTLLRLEAQISLERAPLSFHEVKLAVSSSEEVEHDGSLMQTSLKPIQHNEIEAAPWNPQRYANGGYNDDEDSSSEHADDDDRDFDDDPNGPGDQPPDEPIVHPPASDGNRQSALLYHLDDIPVHTMLNWVDHETMMREVAHHFSRDRVDVLDCHDMTFSRRMYQKARYHSLYSLLEILLSEPSLYWFWLTLLCMGNNRNNTTRRHLE